MKRVARYVPTPEQMLRLQEARDRFFAENKAYVSRTWSKVQRRRQEKARRVAGLGAERTD